MSQAMYSYFHDNIIKSFQMLIKYWHERKQPYDLKVLFLSFSFLFKEMQLTCVV